MPDSILSARLSGRTAATLRGVYLWAGSATVELHRVKFPDRAVDRDAHMAAHTRVAAELLAERGINWAFLSMNWGFPPEIEAPHWAEFRDAVRQYRAAGIRAIGYVQPSNCLAAGSYANRDWYAVTPEGRRVSYFRNRLMTCWNHSDWLEEVGRNAERAIRLGAAGVFFDNLWMGATPWVLGGVAGGFAGCACTRCRSDFELSAGIPMPRRLDADAASAAWLEWRAGIVERRFAGWAARVHSASADAFVLSNSCDIVLRDTRSLFGLDLRRLLPLQDAVLVENVAMPHYEAPRDRLVANALPLKAVRAIAGNRPLMTVTYERGIGLDTAPAPVRIRRAIAEAAAIGAAPVLKGSEYLDDRNRFTVITAPALRPALDAGAPLLRWIESNPELFEGATPAPLMMVYYDVDGMEMRWSDTAPATLATGLALIRAGLPFDFVAAGSLADRTLDRTPLLVPPGIAPPADTFGAHVVQLQCGDVEVPRIASRLRTSRATRRLADPILRAVARSYFGSAPIRRFIDATGITARFLRSPLFTAGAAGRVIERCGVAAPWQASLPALFERSRLANGNIAAHVVNYADTPNLVSLDAGSPPLLHTPDEATRLRSDGNTISLQLQAYAVLEWRIGESARQRRSPSKDEGPRPPAPSATSS